MKAISGNTLLFWMILLYYASIFISETLPLGQVLPIVPLTILLVVSLNNNKGKIRIGFKGLFIYLIIFITFCEISRVWAIDSSLAVSKINSLIFIFLALVIIAMPYSQSRDIDILFKAVMYGGYTIVIYMLFRYGWTGVRQIFSSNTRLNSDVINSNILGMCSAYAIVINVYYILYETVRLRDLLMIPAIVILAASGSRKALLIVFIGVLGLLILKNYDKRKFLRSLGRVLLALICVIVLFLILSRLPIFSHITSRMLNLYSLLQGNETRSTSDAWIRLAYNQLGLRLFKEHPILGIGIANANIFTMQAYGHNHYLHNNYIELLACGGIVGFLLYYSIYVYLLYVFVKTKSFRTAEYDLCLILLVIHLIMDYGAVSYYGKETYIYLLLFCTEAKNLLDQRKNEKLAVVRNGEKSWGKKIRSFDI